jgi:hypothetical protein
MKTLSGAWPPTWDFGGEKPFHPIRSRIANLAFLDMGQSGHLLGNRCGNATESRESNEKPVVRQTSG